MTKRRRKPFWAKLLSGVLVVSMLIGTVGMSTFAAADDPAEEVNVEVTADDASSTEDSTATTPEESEKDADAPETTDGEEAVKPADGEEDSVMDVAPAEAPDAGTSGEGDTDTVPAEQEEADEVQDVLPEEEAAPTEYATIEEFMAACAEMGYAEDEETVRAVIDNCLSIYERLSDEDKANTEVNAAYEALVFYANDLNGGIQTLALLTGEQFSIVVNLGYEENGVIYRIGSTTVVANCQDGTGHSGYNHSMYVPDIIQKAGYTNYTNYTVTRYSGADSGTASDLGNGKWQVHYNITGGVPYRADEAVWVIGDKPTVDDGNVGKPGTDPGGYEGDTKDPTGNSETKYRVQVVYVDRDDKEYNGPSGYAILKCNSSHKMGHSYNCSFKIAHAKEVAERLHDERGDSNYSIYDGWKWYESHRGNNKNATIENHSHNKSTIYFYYKAPGVPSYKYKLTYNANGGVVENKFAYTVEVTTTDDSYKFYSIEPKREGYEFLGWYTQANGGELVTWPKTLTKDKPTGTVYAHWIPKENGSATVTYKSGTGGSGSKTETVPGGVQYTVLSPKDAGITGPAGKVFSHWSCNKGGMYFTGDKITPNNDEHWIFTAVWENDDSESGNAAYKVKWFDKDSGSELKSVDRKGTAGKPVSVKEEDKSYKGYIFDEDNGDNLLNAILKSDGSTVLKLYFVKSNEPEKEEITEFTKELVKTPQEATAANISTSGITFPNRDGIVIVPENEMWEITLLYKITVKGTPGMAYKVEDLHATPESVEDIIPDNGEAVIYVTKPYTNDDVVDGNLINEATLLYSEGDGLKEVDVKTPVGNEEIPDEYYATVVYNAGSHGNISGGKAREELLITNENGQSAAEGTIDISGAEVTADDGWYCIGWKAEAEEDPDWTHNVDLSSGKIAGTKNVPAKANAKYTFTAQYIPKPSKDKLELKAIVDCVNTTIDPLHKDKTYDVQDGSVTVGEITKSGDEYTCEVTVLADEYVKKYTEEMKEAHVLVDPSKGTAKLTLKWNEDDQKWEAEKKQVTFKVRCGKPSANVNIIRNYSYELVDENPVKESKREKGTTPVEIKEGKVTVNADAYKVYDGMEGIDAKEYELKSVTVKKGSEVITDVVPDSGKPLSFAAEADGLYEVTLNYELVETAKKTVTVIYVDEDGRELGRVDDIPKVNYKDPYDVSDKVTETYTDEDGNNYIVLGVDEDGDPEEGTADKDIVVTIICTLDNIGPEGPDKIPDKYQVIVTYEAVNGTINGSKREIVSLKKTDENGKEEYATAEDGGKGYLTAGQIPGTSANEGYGNGVWAPAEPTVTYEITKNTDFVITYSRNTQPTPPGGGGNNDDDDDDDDDDPDPTPTPTSDPTPPVPPTPILPGPTVTPTPVPPTPTVTNVTPVPPTPTAALATADPEVAQLLDEIVPLAGGEEADGEAEPEPVELDEEGVPKAGKGLSWALVNFALMNLAVFESLMLLVGYFVKTKNSSEEEDEEEKKKLKKKGIMRIISLPVAIISIIAFCLTEDITLPTAFVDRYTLLMAIIALVQTAVVALSRKELEDEEEEVKVEA